MKNADHYEDSDEVEELDDVDDLDEFDDIDEVEDESSREPSLRSRVRSRLMKWLAYSVITMLVVYLTFAIPFWTRSVTITKRFVSDFNKEIAATSEQEKAWPLLRRAAIAMRDWDRTAFAKSPPESTVPGDPQFEACVAHTKSWKDSLELVREASTKHRLGHFAGKEDDGLYDSAVPLDERLKANDSIDLERDPILFSMLQQWIGVMRGFTRALGLDMDVAASQGDFARVVEDVKALCLLSGLVADPPNVIGQLTGHAMRVFTARRLGRQLALYPGMFSLAQLDELSEVMKLAGSRHSKIELEWEKRTVEDFAQRIFSDDGQGGGLMTMDGWDLLSVMGGQRWSRGKAFLVGPLVAKAWGTRSQFNTFMKKAFDAAAVESVKAPWERSQTWLTPLEAEAGAADAPKSYFMVMAIVAPTSLAFSACSCAQTEIEAVLAAIAVEKFRMEKSRYPQTLEELRTALGGRMPLDVFSGGELRARFGDAAPVIYSTGADRVDNGGEPSADDAAAAKWINAEELLRLSKSQRDAIQGDWILWPPREIAWADGSSHELVPIRSNAN